MRAAEKLVDYSEVTELSGARGTPAQFARMCQRYHFAVPFCEGKDVLEVACGAGQGLGLLMRRARTVIGVDIDGGIVARAKAYYGQRVDIRRGNALQLDFEDASFDVVIHFEAIYYLSDPEKFIAECRRVLRPGGILLLCTANKDLLDFNPSPFSFRYFSPVELSSLVSPFGFSLECFGGDPLGPATLRSRGFQVVKRAAVKLHLIPRTMTGKERLKRLVFGSLIPLPAEVPDQSPTLDPPRPISLRHPDRQHRVLYAVARLAS